MFEKQDKASSTVAGLSRENSLSSLISLPDTECDWPEVDIGEDTLRMPRPCDHLTGVTINARSSSLEASTTPGQMTITPSSFYQVAFLGGIEVRSGPHFDAPRTGLVMMQNKVFAVSQQLAGSDGRIYLCLADGQGWVFDDSALEPHDPSVVPLPYVQSGLTPPPPTMPAPGSEMGVSPPLAPSGTDQLALPTVAAPRMPPPPPNHPAPGDELTAPSLPAYTMPAGEVQRYTSPPHPAPSGELLASTPTTMMMSQPCQPPPMSWYRIAYLGGIMLRCSPSVDAPWTGVTLPQNEVFAVSEELPSIDGRIYLRLCDGRGWAFDDSSHQPHDPSVKRGKWMTPCEVIGTQVLPEVQADALPARRRHPQPRGKRGGKRCSRRSKLASSTATAPGVLQ